MRSHGAFCSPFPGRAAVNLADRPSKHPPPHHAMNVRALCASGLAAAMLAGLPGAHAQGVPLDDTDLSDTWGQALLDLTNTSLNGYEFSRITFNADITMSTTLNGLKLGTYD